MLICIIHRLNVLCYAVIIISESPETDSASITSEILEKKIGNINCFFNKAQFYANTLRPLESLYNPYFQIMLIDNHNSLKMLQQNNNNLYKKPAKGVLCFNNLVKIYIV